MVSGLFSWTGYVNIRNFKNGPRSRSHHAFFVFFYFVSEDPSRIFVAIGYGFFVEMTHEEALQFIEKKTSQLTLSVSCPHSSGVSCPHFYNSSVNTVFAKVRRSGCSVGWLGATLFSVVSYLCHFVWFRFTEQLTKDSAKIKANIQMVLEVSPLCVMGLRSASELFNRNNLSEIQFQLSFI